MQDSGRWELQLHSGDGHTMIRYGPDPDDTGPYYAYKRAAARTSTTGASVCGPTSSRGRATLAEHLPAYRPLAFAPPFGSYGQDGTNDERIPGDLLGWLTERYRTVFTQDENARARVGGDQLLGRIQVTRATTGGELHEMLLSGEH